MVPHIVGKDYVTLFLEGKTNTIPSTHPNFSRIVDAIKAKEWDVLPTLINVAKSISDFSKGKVVVDNGVVKYNGEALHTSLTERILTMLSEGFDINPLVAFLENLMQNPSKRAVDELYGFLEKSRLPITEDGHFLAYKRVRADFKDCHSGTMDNSVGQVLEMPRNRVDEDKDRTCSAGLHFCSFEYLPHYWGNSGNVVILKINPRDVVSIPSDYNNSKGRACRYEVVGLHDEGDKKEAFVASVAPAPVVAPVVDTSAADYDEGVKAGAAAAEKFQAKGTLGKYDQLKADRKCGKRSAKFAEGFKAGYVKVLSKYEEDARIRVALDEKRATDAGFTLGAADYKAGKPYSLAAVRHPLRTSHKSAFDDGYYNGFYS